jgi:hypothetical protein
VCSFQLALKKSQSATPLEFRDGIVARRTEGCQKKKTDFLGLFGPPSGIVPSAKTAGTLPAIHITQTGKQAGNSFFGSKRVFLY